MKSAFPMIPLLLFSIASHASDLSVSAAEARIRNLAHARAGALSMHEIGELKDTLAQSGLFKAPRLSKEAIEALGELAFLADADKEFQSDLLNNETQLFQRVGLDVDPCGYANLVDRVDAKNGRPTTFGTLSSSEGAQLSADRRRDITRARRYIGIRQPAGTKCGAARFRDERPPLAMRSPVYPTKPEVRAELVDLYVLDQEARDFDDAGLDDARKKAAYARMQEVDAKVLARFRPIFDKYGIPGNRSVGRFGTLAAWTIIQHAITAPEVMRKGVVDAGKLRANGELGDGPYALLVDRVACVIDHTQQTYGTFPVADAKSPWYCPIKDPAKLNERRASVFMEPVLVEQH